MSNIIDRTEAVKNLRKHIGCDLASYAQRYGTTTYSTADKGKITQNKGWKGLILERLAGLENDCKQAPNGDGWELKSVACRVKIDPDTNNEILIPKETMQITMINYWLRHSSFDDSHVWYKLRRLVFCGVQWLGHNDATGVLKQVVNINFDDNAQLIKELREEYETIRSRYIAGGKSGLSTSELEELNNFDNTFLPVDHEFSWKTGLSPRHKELIYKFNDAGTTSLESRYGHWIQARTKGPGGINKKTGQPNRKSRAFYAKRELVMKCLSGTDTL